MGGSGSYSKSCLVQKLNAYPNSTLSNNDLTSIKKKCESKSKSKSKSQTSENFDGNVKNYKEETYVSTTTTYWPSCISSLFLLVIIALLLFVFYRNGKY